MQSLEPLIINTHVQIHPLQCTFHKCPRTPTQHCNNIFSAFASFPSLKGLETIQNLLATFDCEIFGWVLSLLFSVCTSPNKTRSHLIPLQWLIMTTINKSPEFF